MTLVLIILSAIGLAITLAFRIGIGRALRKPARTTCRPPISILKPLCGADPSLEENLRSFFELDYPHVQLVFGVENENDSALPILGRLLEAYPHVDTKVVIEARKVGQNPKVNNLANCAEHAHYDIFVISDSNVRVPQEYLNDIAAHLSHDNVGLVTSPIRASGGLGLGAKLEQLQIHGFVNGGMCAANEIIARPVAMGKSMAFDRATLDAIGGWQQLSAFLAEDQVFAEAVHRQGYHVRTASCVIDNVLGDMTLATFFARHERWGTMRKRLVPKTYVSELLLNPIIFACLAFLITPSLLSGAVAVATWLIKTSIERSCETQLSVTRPWREYFWLVPLKEVANLTIWLAALIQSSTTWRGHLYHIGKQSRATRLLPQPDVSIGAKK